MSNRDICAEWSGDLVVVGGGVTGCVAAIAAARLGLRTVLLHNRPVLGGPSSSEDNPNADGAFVSGASNYVNANAREGGILEELRAEARYRKSVGYENHWSLVLREWVEREPNILLRMNTEAFDVEMCDGRVAAVRGRTLMSDLTCRYSAPLFADCSGDSFVGYAAGAEYRHGREGRAEFGESLAPEEPDDKTMGSSISFRAVDKGYPVPFEPPPRALRGIDEEHLRFRYHGDVSYGYWWMEYGGELDTIGDNEEIYSKLLSILFGVWDHIKNHGDHGADNYVINWVSNVASKRESRRLMGDYILTQRDVVEHPDFPDAVAYGGWPIDLHPPAGFFAKGHPGSSPPFVFPGLYRIPFRCLYSRNVPNLLMAGRNVSVTHVALGTTRLMATCALLGQAVGAAAAVCARHGLDPRDAGREKMDEIRDLLRREDAALPGERVLLADNAAHGARATASSRMFLARAMPCDSSLPLVAPPRDPKLFDPANDPPADRRRAQMFPVSERRVRSVTVYFNNSSPEPVEVGASLHRSRGANDFTETAAVTRAVALIAPGENAPGVYEFDAAVEPGALYHVVLDAVEGVEVRSSSLALPGLYRKADGNYPVSDIICFDIDPPQDVFGPGNINNGLTRPGCWPNAWLSDPEEDLPQEVALEMPAELVSSVELIFDTNMHKTPYYGVPRECARDYEVHLRVEGAWRGVAEVSGNRFRRRVHEFEPVLADAVRLRVSGTNGDASARLLEMRVFRAGGGTAGAR